MDEELKLGLKRMRNDRLFQSGHDERPFDIVGLLNACTITKDLQKGSKLHAYIRQHKSLQENAFVGSTLVSMYAKCGALARAQQVLKELPVQNVISWNALIAEYSHHGQGEKALKCFNGMLHEGHSPDAVTFICALKACGNVGAAVKGKEIHDKIICLGLLEKDIVLGTTLVDMYVKCGALAKAHQVHEELPVRDAVSWNALIAGYAQQGQGERALKCFDDMLLQGYSPTVTTFACALKACGGIGAAAKGKEIHEKIVNLGMLEKHIVLGNSLVDMYAKCGALANARKVHEDLLIRDVVSWNALIAGYVQEGQGEEALKCFDDMLCEGHSPSAVTFICVLKACGSIGAAAKGKEIHCKVVSLGMLEKNIVLGTTLVDMYVKCGALAKAHVVHKELLVHDVVSWNSLIAGYAQKGEGQEALNCFDDMLHEGHSPSVVTFACVLKACGSIGAVAKGEEIHDRIVSLGMLEKYLVLGDCLVDMYVKCGALAKAQQVLEELPVRDVVSWSALIAGYAQKGEGEKALKCFDDMLHEGHTPTMVTFICALKACGSIKAAAKGEEIHDNIVTSDLLEKDIVLGDAVVDMYVKCGALAKAQQVHEDLPVRDVVSWNALIVGYAQEGQAEEVLKFLDDMLCEGHSPTEVTFSCALKACGSIRASAKGEEICDKIVSLGILEKHDVLLNSLVDMYVKCGALAEAQRLHIELRLLRLNEELTICNVVSWNSLIAGYAQRGLGEEALKCFDDMLHEGHCPTSVTFICALKACGRIEAFNRGKEIHDMIVSLRMLDKDIVLGNALVDMYVKCAAFTKAHKVLKELPIRNVVSWNAPIAGYAQQGQGEEALKCFDDMLREGHSPTAATFICVLKACGSIGAAAKGEEIHGRIVSLDMLTKNVVLKKALADMYVKCGVLAKAQRMLEELPVGDAVSWSSLISGYAQQGQSVEAIDCFERMQSNGVRPNLISLTAVLNACSHSGLLAQAETYFAGMSTKYGIHPNLEHYCCMTDVFGRAGKFNKALSVIAKMPYDKCVSSWVALLGACRKWVQLKIGRLAFERALHLDKNNVAIYLLMADIYREAGMQEEAHKIKITGAMTGMGGSTGKLILS